MSKKLTNEQKEEIEDFILNRIENEPLIDKNDASLYNEALKYAEFIVNREKHKILSARLR